MNNNHVEVSEEVHCVASNGSNRRVDTFAVDRSKKLGCISDPTLGFETYEEQPLDVDMEKNKFINLLLDTLKIYII